MNSKRDQPRRIGDIKNCFPGCCTLQAFAKCDNFEINCHDPSRCSSCCVGRPPCHLQRAQLLLN